ncbi:GNAT family N-acetyltransferase [uncultured Porphyromonas sp.]|uniref:GNAT family N-acetyltransferase n=1 Tax=uncultured Porphyromonas sp. TaxID=159274 RepID=UPI0025F4D105|nr:GNAT family N-acetyltransferase [uncultured Porphyromonas sp.]
MPVETEPTPEISISRGTPEMVPIIAKCAMAAIERYNFVDDMDEEQSTLYEWLLDICARTDTLYSYRNTLVAKVDDEVVGCLISYPGDDYEAKRAFTFAALDGAGPSDTETGPGEYYLDTLALLPAARGHRIGLRLMESVIDYAIRELGYDRFTLLVDEDKPRLEAYYTMLDFQRDERVYFMGHPYYRMVRSQK